jgi:hypothetical protein
MEDRPLELKRTMGRTKDGMLTDCPCKVPRPSAAVHRGAWG